MHGYSDLIRYRTRTGEVTREGHYYRCNDSRPSANSASYICHPKNYNGKAADALILKAIAEVARHPELVTFAAAVYQRAEEEEQEAARPTALEAELGKLQARERAIVQAQIRGLELGADTQFYEAELKTVVEQRAKVEAALHEWEQRQAQIPQEQPRQPQPGADSSEGQAVMALAQGDFPAARYLSEYLSNAVEAFTAPELTPAEKHGLLARVVEAIHPAENDGFKIELKPFQIGENGDGANQTVGAVVTWPSSNGWRITSSTSRWNSGSSSRNKTPLWANDISPGRG